MYVVMVVVVGGKGGLGRKEREGGEVLILAPHACLQSHHAHAISMLHPSHRNWQKVGKGGKAARGRGQGGECAEGEERMGKRAAG